MLIYSHGHLHPLHHGDSIRVYGRVTLPLPARNPGDFSYKTYLLTRGIHAVVYASYVKKIKNGSRWSVKRFSFALRDRFIAVYNGTLPHPFNALLTAFIFGSEGAEIPSEMENAFRKSGIIHLMVASGAQIALLLLACFYLPRLLKRNDTALKAATAVFSLLLIFIYTLMTQGGFSILRAFFMGCMIVLAVLTEREYDAFSALFFSAFLILIYQPLALFDAGFQLSFSATFGIIFLSPKLMKWLDEKTKSPSRYIHGFYSLCCATLSAQIFVTPVLLYYFNGISVFSFFINLFSLPLAALLVPLGFLTGMTGLISLLAAKIIAQVCGFFLWLILHAATTISSLPYSFLECARPSIPTMAGYYMLIFYFAQRQIFQKFIPALSPSRAALMGFILFALPAGENAVSPHPLKVIFFDIGQGDSILIQTPERATILIDGGGYETRKRSFNPGESTLLPYMKRQGIKQLDLVVLTHPHKDHLEGLLSVLRERRIKQFLYSSLECKELFCRELQEILKKKKIKTIKAVRGMTFLSGQNIKLTVINPPVKHYTGTHSDIDNNSVALHFTYKNARFLFPGDIFSEAEESILKSGYVFDANVLKVPHHGSRNSSTPPFLRYVRPEIAVISCGRHNVFHHPSLQTLKNLQHEGARVFRTDIQGAVTVETDGSKIWSGTMY